MLGPLFSGKKTQTKKLQELYGVKVIEVSKIIEDAKKVVLRKNEQEEAKKKKPAEDEPEVFVQTCLETQGEDELGRSKLIRARLRGIFGDSPKVEEEIKKQKKDEVKCLGFVIINYPNTIHEAADLERHMSNFIHPSELPEPLSLIKKREALIIASPSKKPPQPKKLFRSAWDLVVFLDVDMQTCITRAVDRRVDPAGNVYNLSYNPPPENILAKCKPVDHPTALEIQEHYEEFLTNKETLMHWFSQFGKEYSSNFLVLKGKENIETVTEGIKNRANLILQSKATPLVTPSNSYRDINALKFEQAKVLAEDWEDLREKYLEGLSYNLSYIKIHYNRYLSTLKQEKNSFFDFILTPDEKPEIFAKYKESINNTILSKQIFTSQEVSKMNQDIEEMMDIMWDIVVYRKDKAINKRQEMIDSSILTFQIAVILEITKNLLQTEINKYYSVINFINKYNHFIELKEYFYMTPPVININWKEWDKERIGSFLLKYLISFAHSSVVNSEEHSPETFIFIKRVQNIENFAKNAIENYRELLENLYGLLDLWIIKAVELENNAITKLAGFLSKTIESRFVLETPEFPSNLDILLELIENQ